MNVGAPVLLAGSMVRRLRSESGISIVGILIAVAIIIFIVIAALVALVVPD